MAEFNFVDTDSAKLYPAIIGALMDSCNEALYPGDERRIFGEALVSVFVALYAEFNDRMKQRTLRYARGSVLDAIGDRYGINRLAPASASAVFRFSVASIQASNIVIPAGTRITTDGTVYFATERTVALNAGTDHVDVTAVCSEGGIIHNGYIAGSIATLVDLIPFIGSVANITETTGGDDGEPDTDDGNERFRERIRLSPAMQSTAGPESAYRFFAMSADPDIVDVHVDCPEEDPNTVNIYALMAGGAVPDRTVLDKISEVLAHDVRPMTDKVTAYAPEQVSFEVEIKYYCIKDDEAATVQAVEAAGGAIDQYIEWQTAKLGRSINPDQLRRFVMVPKSGTGALRLDVVKPKASALSKMQVAKLSKPPVVSHEVVDE